MTALGSQQWYIEEIPAIDQGEETGVATEGPCVSVEGESENTTGSFTALDAGLASLAAPIKEHGTSDSGETSQSSFDDLAAKRRGGAWVCTTVATSSSTQSPSPRGGCSWTKVGSKYLLFGGADASQQHFSDVHCFDAGKGKWEKVSVSGTPPSPRSGHSAVVLGDSLVVYGGMNGQDGVTFNDMFELRTGSMDWVGLPCVGMPPRNSHTAVLHGDTMVIIGGASPEGQTDEVFTVNLLDRTNLHCQRVHCQPSVSGTRLGQPGGVGDAPAPREMHTACVHDQKSELAEGSGGTILLMGGRSTAGVLRDLFSLNTESWSWTRLKDAPVSRCAHSACFVGDAGVMAIYGGWDGGTTVAGDLHLYDTQCGEWTTPSLSAPPVGRFAHAACTGGEHNLLIFGGVNPGEDLTDVVVITAPLDASDNTCSS